ncbi:hypothetical protein [Paeniglutamicibacter gangotriensis]|uniref:Uncharacterized protein n=1 Tax=Paeniglutamicibacter gangotriensis Lz1y TaxID=1276920 RepID=M7MY17_9MICC|nr:hypothetical protein [Paeniglutamicibacter gangotriensis]EMQ99840.1 hypothetical protein ADIAG_00943 [Paeniglutamicibacter gangotriensis Lz1y]
MTAQVPDRVNVQTNNGRVEVIGLNEQDVSYALSLYHAVGNERVQARAALASYVHEAMIEESIPLVSQASQRQVQRSAALRQQLVQENGAETYASLAEFRGTMESSIRTWVSRLRKRREIFTVEARGLVLVPSVQLTDSRDVNPLISELVRPLLYAGLDGWSLWAWLTNPTGLLSGEVPAEVARSNMKRAHKAAERYAAELRTAQATP